MTVSSGGEPPVRPELFYPTNESEGRLLLLIDTFTTPSTGLEGRTKLAKLDFFIRYPAYLARALRIRTGVDIDVSDQSTNTIEQRMVRYRYGPWDPAYFAILGRLLGRGLINAVPTNRGFAYRTTDSGREVADRLRATEIWRSDVDRMKLLKRHFDLTGNWLKQFIYANFPEVSQATWGEHL